MTLWENISVEGQNEELQGFCWAANRQYHTSVEVFWVSWKSSKMSSCLNYIIHYQYSHNQCDRWSSVQLMTHFTIFGVNINVAMRKTAA